MALHVTQCPSCESTFNTSAQMLEAAHGRVRCGACLSVFEANENFVNTLPAASNDELAPGENNSVFITGEVDYFDPATFIIRSELQNQTEQPDDDIAQLDPERHESDSFINEDAAIELDSPVNPAGLEEPPRKELRIMDEPENAAIEINDLDDIDPDTSEAWTFSEPEQFTDAKPEQYTDPEPEQKEEDLNLDIATTPVRSEPVWTIQATFVEQIKGKSQPKNDLEKTRLITPSQTTADAGGDVEAEFFSLFEEGETESAAAADPDSNLSLTIEPTEPVDIVSSESDENDEPVYDDLLLPEETAADNFSPQADNLMQSINSDEFSDEATSGSVLLENQKDTKEVILARLKASRLDEDDFEITPLSNENLAAISAVDDSLELEINKPPRDIKRLVGLSTAIILLGFLLIGQFYWQRMEILSLDPKLRPWYAAVCNVFGCELTPLQDLTSIQTENLVIRTHTEIPGSLVVTAVFRNLATFQQPFPIIELSFSNLDNQLVASRAFLPTEYLPPQLRSIVNMPVGSPVQITMELVDPGEDAVNYSLNFKPFPMRP